MEQIKIGFIGAGPRANSLWSNLISNEEMEEKIYPKACLDKNDKALDSWKYKVDNTYNNFDKFLKEDINAVIIGTPPSTHAPFAIKCLESGINVWSEVPMGLSMDEIWGIIDAEKSNKGNNGKYSYGENYCYMIQPQFMAMKNKENAIGDIYYCESEYSHSVEHYMIEENFYNKVKKELDPELFPDTKPTWRADFPPLKYGHAIGSNLYVLNKNLNGKIEYPIEVTAMGNMKMQQRFKTDNFQIAMVKTNEDTILKMVIAFVLGHHGRIFNSYWGSRGLFVGKNFQAKTHLFYSVSEVMSKYPDRHEGKTLELTDDDLIKMGTPSAPGGHGGADIIMFQTWINSLLNNTSLDIDVYLAAEMTAPGILAQESIVKKKNIDIPKFR